MTIKLLWCIILSSKMPQVFNGDSNAKGYWYMGKNDAAMIT